MSVIRPGINEQERQRKLPGLPVGKPVNFVFGNRSRW
ncbi:hypothetical protein ETAA8_54500 [Anatilimnocola aggregata]|uniref:Uncharacterized protein n=1 Tax=Anatilimnocola aggregata TaxID=2528021 RepID=A0A517YJC5_9BACT|nr:hypothetical protein ETAA8_54500 [Anatilimnocola aggregata]